MFLPFCCNTRSITLIPLIWSSWVYYLGTGPSSNPVILWTSAVSALKATSFKPDQITLPRHMMHILELVTIWKLPFREKSKVFSVFWASMMAIISAWAAELDSGTTRLTPHDTNSLVSALKIAAEKGPPVFFKILELANPKTNSILSSNVPNYLLFSSKQSGIQSGKDKVSEVCIQFLFNKNYKINNQNELYKPSLAYFNNFFHYFFNKCSEEDWERQSW